MRFQRLLKNVNRAFPEFTIWIDGRDVLPMPIRQDFRTQAQRFNATTYIEWDIIVVGQGLFQACKSESELLWLLGHEIAHARLDVGGGGYEPIQEGLSNEQQCDRYGALLVKSAGYDLRGGLSLLHKLDRALPSYTFKSRIGCLKNYIKTGKYEPTKQNRWGDYD